MIIVSFFSLLTGGYVGHITTTSEYLESYISDDNIALEGLYSRDHYYKDGEVKDKGQAPSSDHVFDIPTEQWVIPEGLLIYRVRQQRNQLLAATDYLYRSDMQAKMTEEQRTQLDAYCQALRDITSQDPANVIWPVKPTLP